MRYVLSGLATALFLALFFSQLESRILKAYYTLRSKEASLDTPCRSDPNVCPPPATPYKLMSNKHVTKVPAYYSYVDSRWRLYYSHWKVVIDSDKQCSCNTTVQQSRWYAFNTGLPCGDHVQLCSDSVTMSSQEFAQAVLSQGAMCFPVPVPDMSRAGSYLVALGNRLNALQNLTYSAATRSNVERAGHLFCRLLRTMSIIEVPMAYSGLVSSQVLHMNAVRALASNLDVLAITAMSANMTANLTDAEVEYTRQYLTWHTSRIINLACGEVGVEALPSCGETGTCLLDRPLLLPLRVQQAFSMVCLHSGECNISRFLGKQAQSEREFLSVWHYDAFDYASYMCRPTQCRFLQHSTTFDIVANVVAFFGSLMNAVFFVGLPVAWTVLCWCCFSHKTGSNDVLITPPSKNHADSYTRPANDSAGEPPQVLGPMTLRLLMTQSNASVCLLSRVCCGFVRFSDTHWHRAWSIGYGYASLYLAIYSAQPMLSLGNEWNMRIAYRAHSAMNIE